jgi:Holliday junction resolvase RusA-like endonuclease
VAKMIEFTIYGEPVAKGRPRFTKRGIAYTPQKTSNYENLVKLSYLEIPREKYLNGEQLQAEIIAFFSIPKSKPKKLQLKMLSGEVRHTKRPDLDNIAKSVLDSLNGIAYNDDSQIVTLSVSKYYSLEPRTEIRIFPV